MFQGCRIITLYEHEEHLALLAKNSWSVSFLPSQRRNTAFAVWITSLGSSEDFLKRTACCNMSVSYAVIWVCMKHFLGAWGSCTVFFIYWCVRLSSLQGRQLDDNMQFTQAPPWILSHSPFWSLEFKSNEKKWRDRNAWNIIFNLVL